MGWVCVLSAAVKGEVRAFSDGHQHELRRFRDGGHPRRHVARPQEAHFHRGLEGHQP